MKIFMRTLGRMRKFISHSPIKTKLIVLTMVVSAITTLLLSVSFVVYDITNFRTSLLKELTLTTKITGKRAISSLLFQQPSQAERDLRELEEKDSILMACFYDSNKAFFAEYSRDKENYNCPKEAPKLGHEFSRNSLTVHYPITSRLSAATQGSIYVYSDLRDIYNHVVRYAVVVVVIMAGVILIGYFLSLKLQRIISIPIVSLSRSARKAAKKDDYSRRAKRYFDDEIGELTTAFNDLMQTVQDGRMNLEKKVKERTEDLEKEKIKAEAANQAKSEFLRNMSHEFRTPLHAMTAYSTFGMSEVDEGDREELKGYFEKISKVTGRLTMLVESLLSVAQLEQGKQTFHMEEQDLSKTVLSVVAEQQSLLDKKDITFKLKKPRKKPLAKYDEHKMIQVFTNILGNAIKFTDIGKCITVEIKETEIGRKHVKKAYAIDISDQGIGIPEDELKKVFDKFVQSSRTNTGAGGTGLGLAIAQKIVKGHGGRIFAKSNKDGGATFVIIIPSQQKVGTKNVRVI